MPGHTRSHALSPSCSMTCPISFCLPIAAAISEMIANGVILIIHSMKSTTYVLQKKIESTYLKHMYDDETYH